MKERPILFSAPMIAALLDGTKTQTRRVVKASGEGVRCPYGKPGDRLWVRETHALVTATAYRASVGVQQTVNPSDPSEAAIYRAGWDRTRSTRWRPSIHMPRWASRISLAITEVRVERLQAITAADARAEGVAGVAEYRLLWDVIHGADAWEVNPWVWVVVFEREVLHA